MALSVSRPVKHPRTGVYLYRRRVPDRLRTLVGKREEKRSLGTKDPVEAKRRHMHVHAEVAAEWKAREAAPASRSRLQMVKLSHKELVGLAGEVYRKTVAQYEDEPGEPNQ